ncbi:MAG: glutaminase A [Candidatus Microbacterium stercoravium]|uniref:Glutaminase n=1 Tax=Candidatus Microbacterium stercoravium TaxID=2838697 RepID=A0A9D2H8C2_9MICO|nr:glutaminase A [Candidatus Microbacterium stercoravium]
MRERELDVVDVTQEASTGDVPSDAQIDELLQQAYLRCAANVGGEIANYIPALAQADPDALGVCIADVDGGLHEIGDTRTAFSIQSISKAFVFALLAEEVGHDEVFDLVGANNTGLSFSSVVAIEINDGHPMNPMVNAGALATTALIPGDTFDDRWEKIRTGLSQFAGRELIVDEVVYTSESLNNHRNRAIAQLLQSYDRIEGDPAEVVDLYTRQCSVRVDARDLAVMGATLAYGGVNPLTGERVVSPETCRDTLAVLTASGLYENSGEWLFEIGLPGKSGVAGGLVTVAPGKVAIGTYAPRLDKAGNSIRGQIATAYLSRALGLNIFASGSRSTGPVPA